MESCFPIPLFLSVSECASLLSVRVRYKMQNHLFRLQAAFGCRSERERLGERARDSGRAWPESGVRRRRRMLAEREEEKRQTVSSSLSKEQVAAAYVNVNKPRDISAGCSW